MSGWLAYRRCIEDVYVYVCLFVSSIFSTVDVYNDHNDIMKININNIAYGLSSSWLFCSSSYHFLIWNALLPIISTFCDPSCPSLTHILQEASLPPSLQDLFTPCTGLLGYPSGNVRGLLWINLMMQFSSAHVLSPRLDFKPPQGPFSQKRYSTQ